LTWVGIFDDTTGLPTMRSDGTTNIVYGLGNERLQTVTAGVATWFTHDHLGSTRQTLTSSGTVAGSARYDAWGVPLENTTGSRVGFTGELTDNGLVYLRARWYNPATGTFTSRDPFPGVDTVPQSLHPYAYTHNNPVNATDPSGKDPWWLDPPERSPYAYISHKDLAEWQERHCAYAHRMRAPNLRAYCGPEPLTSPLLDALPGFGDLKGGIEAFAGCDILTGEPLGPERWLGLTGLSEFRWLAKLPSTTWLRKTPEPHLGMAVRGSPPRSIEEQEVLEIVKGVNVHPDDIYNCAYCAKAADERYAGNLDAVAQSGPKLTQREIQALYPGRNFQSVSDPSQIRQAFLAGPEGSRGIVSVHFNAEKDAQGQPRIGHAFNVIKYKGGVYFVDAQNEVLLTDKDVRFWERYFFLQTDP
jgi:RHS repeat-associated protein